MIRDAVADDIPRLVEMGQRFIASTHYCGRMANNPEALAALMGNLIASPDGLVLVVEVSDGLVGMIGGFVYCHPMSWEGWGGEAFLWVEPEHRGGLMAARLIREFEDWADGKGAVRSTMVCPEGSGRVGMLYERLGYSKLETHYQKDI